MIQKKACDETEEKNSNSLFSSRTRFVVVLVQSDLPPSEA